MKLTRVHIIKSVGCGGLLDGLDIALHAPVDGPERFDPLCLVGPNGTGKSQLLQAIAEAFQVVFNQSVPSEERYEGSRDLEFEIEYTIRPAPDREPVLVRLSRRREGRRRVPPKVERKDGVDWVECQSLTAHETQALLPARVIGYTSGDNETLSLPFLVSRSKYADEVSTRALYQDPTKSPDTRLWRIDYGTHMEVLVANLILGLPPVRDKLLEDTRLADIHSFRCIVQLAHSAVPRLTGRGASGRKRKGVQLTQELERYIEQLGSCSTCYSYDVKTETYIFDFLVDEETRKAFKSFWPTAMHLWSAFHKLSMLNDLAIPKQSRERLQHDIQTGHFGSRLPEPQEEDRVFRFKEVRFKPLQQEGKEVVDYVSLSDGEHQLIQILGTMCMVSDANVLFLLDEPESHFNPQWRIKLISRLMDLPTARGMRSDAGSAPAQQDCLMTTHAPFVPSDMSSENVLIFRRNDEQGEGNVRLKVERPRIETFGTTFDKILQVCFGVRPPISELSRAKIANLEREDISEKELREGIAELGDSVQKVFLMDRYRQLLERKGE